MLAVRPGPDLGAEASDGSSRSSDSHYLDQAPRRPGRPPRPVLEEPRDVAEEQSVSVGKAISRPWEDTKLLSHPIRADPKLKVEKMLERRDTRKVKAAVPAIGNLVQEQLQVKYGVSLDMDDFIRKVDSLCKAQLSGDDWEPTQVVSCFNGIKDMRFRTRDARILELRIEPRSLDFSSMLEEVQHMVGTCSAVAVVNNNSRAASVAVAVFRQDYARPRSALVGRCAELTCEPVLSFTAAQLDHAMALNVSIVEVLRLHGEVEALPRFRAEYLSLKGEQQELRAAPDRGRQGLADALMERRAAEASQPSVVSMAMDWLWSGGRSSWMPSSSQRSGTSAPPSSHRHSAQYHPEAKLQQKVRKISPTGRFGYSAQGRFSQRSSSRPGTRQMEMPAPLLTAGPGPATLSRADSPETPPAARMRKDELWRDDPICKDVVIEDPPRRKDDSKDWGFCS